MSIDTDQQAQAFTILLVDDDLDVLGANARFLRLNDIQVVLADSVTAALQRLEKEIIDAIVTDLRMPGSSGLEFAAQARVLKPLLPIIFFSGFATVADVVAAMRLGAVDFLEKPVEPQDLLGTLQSVRDRYTGAINPQGLVAVVGDDSVPFRQRILAYEKLLIEQSLAKHDGHVGQVIAALQINRRTLNDKMLRLGINRHTHH